VHTDALADAEPGHAYDVAAVTGHGTVGAKSDARIVELGCGVGLPSLAIAARGHRVFATDYETDEKGVFTGNLIGKWLWGPDKAEAVKAFASDPDGELSNIQFLRTAQETEEAER
jgi:predicted RNA methylase